MKVNYVNTINFTPKFFNIKNRVQNPIYKNQLNQDVVSFSGKYSTKDSVGISVKKAQTVADSLSTSTAGHRAQWGSDLLNKDVIKLLTVGVAQYVHDESKNAHLFAKVQKMTWRSITKMS